MLISHLERYRERLCIRCFFLLLGIILPTGWVFPQQVPPFHCLPEFVLRFYPASLTQVPPDPFTRVSPWPQRYDPLYGSYAYRLTADSLFDRLHYREAASRYLILLTTLTERDPARYDVVNRLAECYWWQMKCDEAEALLRKALPEAIGTLGPGHPETGRLYLNLGIVSLLTMRSGLTEEYMEQAREIFSRNFGEVHPLTALVYEWLGTAHEGRSDTNTARKYLTQSLRIREKLVPPGDLSMGNLSRYWGLFYKRFARHDSALLWFNRALRIFDAAYGPDNFQSVKCINNLCDIYQDAHRVDTAMALYREALRRTGQASGESWMARFMTLFNLAEFMDYQGKTGEALEYMNQVIGLYDPVFTGNLVTTNPSAVPVRANHYLKLAFIWKAHYLRKLSEQEQNPGDKLALLIAALSCDSVSDLISNRIRDCIFNYDNLLLYEQTLSRVYFNFALQALGIWDQTRDTRYFSMALRYLEINRNIQMTRLNGKDPFTGPPVRNGIRQEQFTDQGLSLQSTINELKNRLLQERNREKRLILERELREEKLRLDQFYYTISAGNSTPRNAFHTSADVSLPELQRRLDAHTMLLDIVECFPDYLAKPESFLVIGITADAAVYKVIPGDSLHHWLGQFAACASDPASPLSTLQQSGARIRTCLLDPFDGIRGNRNRLVLIPSTHTWLIPFDALPLSPPAPSGLCRYLIEERTITLDFSLVSWLSWHKGTTNDQVVRTVAKPGDVLAIAPRFHSGLKQELSVLTRRDTSLIDLPGSRKECEAIAACWPARVVTGYDATETLFDSLAPRYGIVHLSTHGVQASTDSGVLLLAFNTPEEDSLHQGFLSLYEILNMRLSNELVVLSACKSALGVPNKSEGTINLAWAFRQAGVHSAVVSLWDVNDYASSEIMPCFYAALADGKSKPDALRQAKLAFISMHDQPFAHPFFWAPFHYIGDDYCIQASVPGVPFFPPGAQWPIAAVTILMLFFLVYRYIKKS